MIKTHDIHTPVSWWTMDTADISGSTLYDVSGNNNDGTIYGAVSTPGIINEALSFNGAGNYVDVGDIAVHGTDLTFSAWINVNDVDNDQRSIITKYGVADADRAFLFGVDIGGSLRFYTWDGSPVTRKKTATGVISTSTWHHVVVVYDESANDADIYVDNVLKPNSQVDDVLDKIQNVATPTFIGGRAFGGDDMDGSIDDLRIYDYALTSEEIKTLYKEGAFVAWWTMDTADISGSTLYDVSGNNNDGTIYGAVSTPGIINEALSFNGTIDHVDVAHASSIDFADEDFSVSVWFKTLSVATRNYILSKNYGDEGVAWYGINILPDERAIICYVDDGVNNSMVNTTNSYNDGAWHHLVFVRNTTTNKLIAYVDGEWNAENTDISGSIANNGILTIGARADLETGRFFDGSIDDIRIYKYALTLEEVKTLYGIEYDIIIKNITILPSNELDTDTQWSISADIENPNAVDVPIEVLSFYSEERDVFHRIYNLIVRANTTITVKTPVFNPLPAGTYNVCCVDSMVE